MISRVKIEKEFSFTNAQALQAWADENLIGTPEPPPDDYYPNDYDILFNDSVGSNDGPPVGKATTLTLFWSGVSDGLVSDHYLCNEGEGWRLTNTWIEGEEMADKWESCQLHGSVHNSVNTAVELAQFKSYYLDNNGHHDDESYWEWKLLLPENEPLERTYGTINYQYDSCDGGSDCCDITDDITALRANVRSDYAAQGLVAPDALWVRIEENGNSVFNPWSGYRIHAWSQGYSEVIMPDRIEAIYTQWWYRNVLIDEGGIDDRHLAYWRFGIGNDPRAEDMGWGDNCVGYNVGGLSRYVMPAHDGRWTPAGWLGVGWQVEEDWTQLTRERLEYTLNIGPFNPFQSQPPSGYRKIKLNDHIDIHRTRKIHAKKNE